MSDTPDLKPLSPVQRLLNAYRGPHAMWWMLGTAGLVGMFVTLFLLVPELRALLGALWGITAGRLLKEPVQEAVQAAGARRKDRKAQKKLEQDTAVHNAGVENAYEEEAKAIAAAKAAREAAAKGDGPPPDKPTGDFFDRD